VTIEYLETKAPPRQRRWPWLPGLAVVLVLAAVAGFVVWSEQAKGAANQTLSAAVFEAQERSRVGEDRVLSTLAYAAPMIWSTEVPEDVQAGLRALVERSAADASATPTEVADSVAGIWLLPWQGAQRQARDAVMDLIVAERSRFDRIAADARQIGSVLGEARPSEDEALAALRASGANEDPVR
jgi:hypothetical protein